MQAQEAGQVSTVKNVQQKLPKFQLKVQPNILLLAYSAGQGFPMFDPQMKPVVMPKLQMSEFTQIIEAGNIELEAKNVIILVGTDTIHKQTQTVRTSVTATGYRLSGQRIPQSE